MRLFRSRDPHEPDGTDETKKTEEYSWKYDKKETKDFFAAHGSRLWIVGQVVRPVKGAEEQEAGYEKAPGDRFFCFALRSGRQECRLLRFLHLSLR